VEFPLLELRNNKHFCAACAKQVHPTQLRKHQQKHKIEDGGFYCHTCLIDLSRVTVRESYVPKTARRVEDLRANKKLALKWHLGDKSSKTSHVLCEAQKKLMYCPKHIVPITPRPEARGRKKTIVAFNKDTNDYEEVPNPEAGAKQGDHSACGAPITYRQVVDMLLLKRRPLNTRERKLYMRMIEISDKENAALVRQPEVVVKARDDSDDEEGAQAGSEEIATRTQDISYQRQYESDAYVKLVDAVFTSQVPDDAEVLIRSLDKDQMYRLEHAFDQASYMYEDSDKPPDAFLTEAEYEDLSDLWEQETEHLRRAEFGSHTMDAQSAHALPTHKPDDTWIGTVNGHRMRFFLYRNASEAEIKMQELTREEATNRANAGMGATVHSIGRRFYLNEPDTAHNIYNTSDYHATVLPSDGVILRSMYMGRFKKKSAILLFYAPASAQLTRDDLYKSMINSNIKVWM